MTYIPSSFIASFTPKRLDSGNHSLSRTDFREVAQAEPDLSLETNRFTVHLSKSSSTQVACSHDGQVTLLLHGEIYAGAITNPANYLLERYLDEGLKIAKDVNGSFAILLVDKRTDQVALITDRLNYREVFTSKYKGSRWLSTPLTYHLHPVDDLKLDPVGIAFYLTNRKIPNDRTLFAGIRALERACVHTLTEDGFKVKKYWSYELNDSRAGIDEKTLQANLSDLLIEGVRKRVADDPKVFLSLSAGYDSTTILGLLHKLQVPEVECFSYANGDPEPNSDSEILGRCPPTNGFQKKGIYLSLDQGKSKLFAFRANFAGPFVNVRSPLLDNDIIEFMATVPYSLMLNKRRYRDTVTKMFPDLFKFKRATTSGFSEYSWERAALSVPHPQIEDFVSNQESPLDEFIPPDVILDLLKEQRASIVQTNQGFRGMARVSRLRVLNSSIASWGIRKWRGSRINVRKIRQTTFLISALHLRLVLHRRLRKNSPLVV